MIGWLLFKRKLLSAYNGVRRMTPWRLARNAAFLLMGAALLTALYFSFLRPLKYLNSVSMIGTLLLWKLTALATLATFAMVVLSSLLTSMTTLFYAFDLPFLTKAPVPMRSVFLEKAVESAFFASWMIGVALVPYVLALQRVQSLGWTFFLAFAVLLVPFLALAAAVGTAFTLSVMYAFPSPRTRDAIWILSSASLTVLYVLMRLAQPEKLVHPDALEFVAQYLNYLQAPTARYLPSWWLTRALMAFSLADWGAFWRFSGLLYAAAAAVYGTLVLAAHRMYAPAYSGAQEGRRSHRPTSVALSPEGRVFLWARAPLQVASLFWKERKTFFRDVAHWSQIALVAALLLVYLFSIRQLPLDSPDLKSLVSFLNLAAAGFVISSLGLRFTFPAVSLEGKSFWVLKAAPVSLDRVMLEKFLFNAGPTIVLSLILIVVSNRLLQADPFISRLSVGTILVMAPALCAMGVGFGALFPQFNVPNIHQIESSAGGFAYMAASMAYIAMTLAIEAPVVHMHFRARFGSYEHWSWGLTGLCAASLAVLNGAAVVLPWTLGRRALQAHEE